jgi:hypothetical protein
VDQRRACSRGERYERLREGGGFCVRQIRRRVGQSRGNARGLCRHDEVYHGDPMPYYQEFTPDIGFHVGRLPGYPDSHGCVRLDRADAVWLWNWPTHGSIRVRVRSSWSPSSRYTVQPGDVLSTIAQCSGVSLRALRAANRNVLRPGDGIRVGDVLTIPNR